MSKPTLPKKPELYFALGQILLGLCFLVCLLIIPGYFFARDQGGVSNYGTDPRTQGLFVAGFALATLGTVVSAYTLPANTRRKLHVQLGLYVLAAFYVAVLLSTFSYKLSDSLRDLHLRAAIALFAVMFQEALWLRFVAVKDTAIKRAFVIFCVSIVTGLLTLFGYLHILFTFQIVAGVAFGYMATHGIALLRKKK